MELDFSPFERYRPIVDDWAAFTEALRRPLPVCVWTNTLRTTPEALAGWLAREGWAAEPLAWNPAAFRLPAGVSPGAALPYVAGLYHVQEEVSLLPPILLDPQPGERVLDLCAAPGNKTVQMAVAMQNRGTVVANDRNSGRLHVVRTALARLGVANTSTVCHDAAGYPLEDGPYDRVLADVPCTCEGTSRKHPHVLARLSVADACRKSILQEAILHRAVRLCRPGGRVVYSTCSYAPEENEHVVDAVLRAHDDLRLLPARIDGFEASAGLTAWEGRALHADLHQALRVWPHQHDAGGFFVAVLEKAEA